MDDARWIPIQEGLQIPLAELKFRFSTSSGPGGQHANRSATKVTLLFDVANSPSLPKDIRQRLLKKLAKRLDKEGVLQIQVQSTRSQRRNRDTAVGLLQKLLADALKRQKKRRRTRPTAAAKEKRLAEKKKRGERKRERGRDFFD